MQNQLEMSQVKLIQSVLGCACIVRLSVMNLFHPLVVVSASNVLWVVLETSDELFHFLSFKADLIDSCEQRKPADESRQTLIL